MDNTEKSAIISRIGELIDELEGRHWRKICERLRQEGYGELNPNMLRKRWDRWEAGKRKKGSTRVEQPPRRMTGDWKGLDHPGDGVARPVVVSRLASV